MTEKDVIVISRHWHNPHIRVVVKTEGIDVGMTLADFVAALVEETGNPTAMVTQAQLKKKLLVASEAVLRKMKQATNSVM